MLIGDTVTYSEACFPRVNLPESLKPILSSIKDFILLS